MMQIRYTTGLDIPKQTTSLFRFVLFVSIVFLMFVSMPARATDSQDIAVLYPKVPEPYSIVFDDIIDGIERKYQGKIQRMVLSQEASLAEVEQWLESRAIDDVIALGNQAMNITNRLPENYVTVTGAVLSVDPVENLAPEFSAIVLAPDPDHTFAQLKALAPQVDIVSVIYNENYHGRLVARATEVAKQYGITLEVHKATGSSEDSQQYKQFFRADDTERRAVWLLQGDRVLENRSVLYNLLKDAWYNKLLVFSDNPSYVKKGVLFALYPDNSGMGESLVEALDKQQKGQNIGVVQTRNLHSALNIRTAEHLGLSLSRSQRREFDVIFPRR